MRVLIAVFADYPGGSASANHVQKIARGLMASGAEVKVIGFHQQGNQSLEDIDEHDVAYVSFPLPKLIKWLPPYFSLTCHFAHGLYRKLEELFSQGQWDAVIYHGRSWFVMKHLLPLCQKHQVLALPYLVEWHGLSAKRLINGSHIDQWLFRQFMIARCPGIIGISHWWNQLAEAKGVPCAIVPSFADDPDNAPTPVTEKKNEAFALTFVGTWIKRELPMTLLKGLRLAIDRGVNVQLIVLGKVGHRLAEKQAMNYLASDPVLQKHVTLTGWLTDEQLQDYLLNADAFVLLREQNRETKALFPTRLPEYLVTGNPVILSEAGDLPCYLKHGESAWFIPPGEQPEALADAIEKLASDLPLRQSIGLAGRESAFREFALSKLGQRIEQFIERIKTQSSTCVSSEQSIK